VSSTNLDLPVLMSADQIRRREFVTTRRGYDPEQVRAYLEQVAEQVELMRSSLLDARSQVQAPVRVSVAPKEPAPDPYEQLGARVASVIREADETADKIRRDARRESEQLTREARTDADRIRTDAQANAEEAKVRADAAVRAAREEADRTIAGLATRRDTLVEQLAAMQERVLGVARDLESAMDVKVMLPDLPSLPDMGDAGRRDAPHDIGSHEEAPLGGGSLDDDPHEDGSHDADGGRSSAETFTLLGRTETEEEHTEASLLDPSYEELWEGTDSIRIELPDIPALELEWGEDADEQRD
jgi:DivIVA domain-containing protein